MNAVILAGRQEKQFDIPVSLIEIAEGVTLLERSIKLLKEVGISKILIVTGYKSELFSQIPDVSVVCNERFMDTASMASLALAESFVSEDFLLIESDLLYEKDFLIRLIASVGKNCLSIVCEMGTGDEAFVELENGFVRNISKDIHQLFRVDGEMIGVSKISIHTFRQMLEAWKVCDNPMMNYEYLLLRCAQLHEISAIKSTDLVCYEVDNQKDFHYLKEVVYPKLCRKENPFDKQNVFDIFQNIMQVYDISEHDVLITQIGGMTNRNFKVDRANESYVLRIPGNGTDGMIVREYEDYNSKLAYRLGVTPEIFYLDVQSGVKLARYIEGAETLNNVTIQYASHLEKVIVGLRTLHTSGVRFNNDFNVIKEIRVYEQLLDKVNGWMYEGYADLRPRFFALEDRLNQLGVTLAPCHNDLVAENFVKGFDGKIYLIDWEYSGMNDPLWDLAALFIENSFSEENQQKALSLYYGNHIPEGVVQKILIYQVLMDLLWSIWTRIKETQGDNFGNYGLMRFQRAVGNLEQLEVGTGDL
ncbi:phosphotransferase [uncultured Parabacteroides sp.]|uniref:phosphotransferase n=1 Tax=uncultured Parabacteroides sp. TaxID=512312 RepID=UPI0026026398|nr:phosphotransferase [uncultured Parabacteroides sp.]